MSSSKPRPTCCCPDKCFLIKSITSVTLDLQDNNTGSEGTEALAGLLQGNTSVTILHRNMRR